MRQYSIFYLENGHLYPIFQKGTDFWLGGNRLDNLLFYNRTMAEKTAKTIRLQNPNWSTKGTVKVLRAETTPLNY